MASPSPPVEPIGSPSQAVEGSVPMSAPAPARLSPSDNAEEGGARRAIGDIFDDDDDDDDDRGGGAGAAAAGDEDEEEDADEEEERQRRRRRRREELEEDAGAEASQRRKKTRKERTPEAEPEDEDNGLPQLTAEEERRKNLDTRINEALKKGKKKIKRRAKDGEEDLDHQADAEVAELRSAMMNAADDDVLANEDRKPALAKLRMLPRVVDGLQKQHWQQSIFDSNLLEAVRRFLEPLPDKSLPALNIQRELFKALEKLSPAIDTISLKMSGLGKVVMFYSRNRRVESDLRRRADRLIEAWSRPILKRSASYRAMEIPKATSVYMPSSARPSSQAAALLDSQSQIDNSRRNVSIPQPIAGGFKVAPRSLVGASDEGGDASVRAAIAGRERLNAFKRKVREAKR